MKSSSNMTEMPYSSLPHDMKEKAQRSRDQVYFRYVPLQIAMTCDFRRLNLHPPPAKNIMTACGPDMPASSAFRLLKNDTAPSVARHVQHSLADQHRLFRKQPSFSCASIFKRAIETGDPCAFRERSAVVGCTHMSSEG